LVEEQPTKEEAMTEGQTAARPRWASYAEAERMCGLSRWTLWRLAKAGQIRAARIGNVTRLDLDSIETFLEERAEEYARS
jgi:excisionase family DNA binding protein